MCDEEDVRRGSGVFGFADDGGVIFSADFADEAEDEKKKKLAERDREEAVLEK